MRIMGGVLIRGYIGVILRNTHMSSIHLYVQVSYTEHTLETYKCTHVLNVAALVFHIIL